MAKQSINVGTTANDKKGDSLRAAFVKVNANFTELYTELGLAADANLNLGAFEFSGSTMSTTDSSAIVIDQAATITSNLSVGGDIVPQTANGGDLGSSTLPWRSLYVSGSTIYIGGNSLSINNQGELTFNNNRVAHENGEFMTLDNLSDLNVNNPNAGDTIAWAGYQWVNVPLTQDRLADDGDEVVLVGGANPYVTFPAITGGDQLIIQGAEVSSVSGSLALTSQDNLNIIANGSGAAPGGSKNWTFGDNGSLTIPGDIRSDSNINIDINLADSTLRRWQFGEDGNLEAPGIVSAAGLRTSETKIALGSNAGQTSQGSNGVAVGAFAGQTSQGPLSVAIGYGAGATTQGVNSVAVGNLAGSTTQGGLSVAVGSGAGQVNQSYEAVAVGFTTGLQDQGTWAVAIGSYAGAFSQGEDAIAIGRFAGQTNQPDNTIILNASGSAVDGVAAQTNSFYVAPIRNIGGTSGVLQYNAATKEVSYSSDITSEGNINIEINLSDSTLRRWQFGEDGELTLPEDAVIKTMSGNLTIEGESYVFIDSATNGQIDIGRSSGVGAVSLGNKSNGTNVVVDDLFVANGVYEFFSSLADATGVVTHNCANGHIFYHTSPDANWTVNLTNLLDTWNRATSVTLIIAQGAIGYYPSAVQIAGVAQTLNWQGNATPTPSTNRTDVVTFSIINNSGTYTVLGQLTGF